MYSVLHAIMPDYFATLGTPVLAGREFNERDTSGAPHVAVVNDAFAQYFLATARCWGDASRLST